MQNHNAKLKIIFILVVSLLFSGCVRNVDLRKQAEEKKASISSIQSEADFKNANTSMSENIVKDNGPVKILFVGDMMFDRHIREAVGKYGSDDYNYALEPLREKLSEYDLVVGNLEGPITENKSVSIDSKIGESKNFVFTFDPAVARVLAENNIKLVNLGNNHILNQGEKGIEQTKKYLDESEVDYFGNLGTESLSKFKVINGMEIGFVGYNYSVPDSADAAIKKIEIVKNESDFVIVCPHWGTEYKVDDPGESVRSLAKRFIDAGADAVIGTHPHVVQMSEEYNGRKIYYSLGNFVFDQYFQKETMEGLGVEMTINPDPLTELRTGYTMEYSELKFEMTKRGQTILMQNANIKNQNDN